MAESTVVSHGRCPRCRDRGRDNHADNLATYSDGHKYCFSCGYIINSNGTGFLPIAPPEKPRSIFLPNDADTLIPAKPAGLWLQKYDITAEEVKQNKFLWSQKQELLIFPFYDSSEKDLVAWQGRYLGPDTNRTKYYTIGPKDLVFSYFGLQFVKESGIILVEDMISAIKVGRVACCLPLLGSFCPLVKQRNLMRVSDKLTIWLDYDKAGSSYAMAKYLRTLGYETRTVVTPKDPKECFDDEISDVVYI